MSGTWPGTALLGSLSACLLASLSACSGDPFGDPSGNPSEATAGQSAIERPVAASALADEAAGSIANTLTLGWREGQLRLDWRFDAAAVRNAGAGARLHLELLDVQRGNVLVDELRPALDGTPARGNARLSVEAHRLAWHSLALRARVSDTDGATLATGEPVPLAATLAQGARFVELPNDDQRAGSAVAFSHDGTTLVVADPDDARLRLYSFTQAEPGTVPLDALFERIPIDGLAAATPGSIVIAASSFGATLALVWRDADGRYVQAIVEATPTGFTESVRHRFDTLRSPELALSSDGQRLDLVDATGAHERFVKSGATWQHRSLPSHGPAAAASVDGEGVVTRLQLTPGQPATIETQGRGSSLPGTESLADRALPRPLTLRLDPEGLQVALATLEPASDKPSSASPARYLATLRLFSRIDDTSPWRQDTIDRRAVTSVETRSTLRFGRRSSAPVDTLLWHWGSQQGDSSSNGSGSPGLAMLTTREPASGFGIADRSDRPRGRWRLAFSMPADGAPPVGPIGPKSATLSADGTSLVFVQPTVSGHRAVMID